MLTDTGLVLPNFTELRIYPSFTEIRQQYNAPKNFTICFSRGVFANIPRGSLSIEGVPIESKQIVPKANNLENQTIFVQRHSNEEPQECNVIQADDLLLQNIKTKRYFFAQRHEIEYVNIPEQEETAVTYVLKHQGKATLSYQIQGITWSPQYDLSIQSDDCQHIFQAFAEITNGTKQVYRIDRTELLGGDIVLQRDVASKRRRDRSRSRSRSLSETSDEDDEEFDSCDITPTVGELGELAGLYRYSIDQPFVLLPKSTFGLPFINATIQVSKYFGLTLPFTSHTQIRKLQRKYRIESIDKFLPGGLLTIREQDRLVGVITIPDLAIGDKYTLTSGEDPGVSLNRQVKLISKERHSGVYAVHLTFKNIKSTPVKFDYKEIVDSKNAQFKIILKGSDDQRAQIQVTANGVQIENKNNTTDHRGMLVANGGEQIFEYEIHINYPTPSSTHRKRRREE
ncbi:unnamed protein product [Rotaria magnacalcarata]|uniref:DUF4139 domain-containing protein n=1 Tax=Rotaria magnacalcarata TaxID=392030 RepID=A0A816TQB9_9BILA|nr:unnamed protein product [Rotaria magnacalcarata]CAF4059161.1 unnamed protein product [Rotaria magnacalcarata]